MKRRIKEITDSNGVTRYVVQFRFLFIWMTEKVFFDFYEAYSFRVYKHTVKVKYHK